MQQLLAAESVQFTEWLLLATLRELIEETGEAVSQSAIADRAGLTRQIASYWLIALSEDALVDREPGAEGPAWRVLLTKLGERTLQSCDERLEAAGLSG